MALILADRVKVRSRTTGLTDFTLENTLAGFQSFEVIGDGNTTYYGITDVSGNWEIGIGTYIASGPTLSRDTIISSSDAGNKVNFPVGSKNVFCTFPSSALQTVATGGFGNFEFIGSIISTVDSSSISLDSGSHAWTFGADGTVTFPGGSTIDNQGSISQGDFNITIPGDIAGTPQQFKFSDEGGTGELVFPDGTRQSTAFATNGNAILYPGDIIQSYNDNVNCLPGIETVIYTSTDQYQHAIKLFVMVEGLEDGGGVNWETQACDIIAVKGYNNNIVHVTAYGVTYSGATPLATFDGQWNATSNRIEITCTSVSITNPINVSVHAIEMTSND